MTNYELLSNYDIIELSKISKINLIGCVAKDILQNMTFKNGSYVINLDNSNSGKGGTHWVALFIKNNNCCYFDPFGIIPPIEILKFCKGHNFIYSKDQIQYITQICCGYYCIAFLHFMTNNTKYNIKLKNILNLFLKPFDLDNTKNNDNILQQYLKFNISI